MDQDWAELKDLYSKRGLCLFLGAGISLGAGVPSWDGLLQQIASRLDEATQKTLEEWTASHTSLPVIAGWRGPQK